MTDKMYTEKEVAEIKARVQQETAIRVAGNTVLTRCLGYIGDDIKAGRATKLEYDTLIMIYQQFMGPAVPVPSSEPVPTGKDETLKED